MTTARLTVSALMLTLACLSGQSAAQPYGWSVNSRGFLPQDQMHQLWRVNLATGEAEALGQTGFIDIEGLAFGPDGTLYGADDESKSLITINLNSGFASPVGNLRNNMGVALTPLDFGMTFGCDGAMTISSDVEQRLFSVDLSSGQVTAAPATGDLGAPITDIAVWRGRMYGIGQGLRDENDQLVTDSPNLYLIDPVAHTAELIGPLGPAVAPYANAGLAFDETGVLWAVTDRRDGGAPDLNSEILRIDPETGAAQKVADADVVGFESLAITSINGCLGDEPADGDDPPAIPVDHPGALALLILALLLPALWTLSPRQR